MPIIPIAKKNFFFLFLSLCLGVNFAYAFTPNYPAALAPGDHHTRITEQALAEIYAQFDYGPLGSKPYTNNIKQVIETITQSNADVDHDDATKISPVWHCDDEMLSPCSNLVKSETNIGVNEINSGNYSTARERIGAVTHTLQDFYAHSNWIEMRGSIVNTEMGYGDISNVASPSENTCTRFDIPSFTVPSVLCERWNDNNIINNGRLTSGYFKTNIGGRPPAGVNKCYHGGSFDGETTEGINKDSSACHMGLLVISPHNSFHHAASGASRAATVEYFKKLQSRVKDEETFKKFLGIGPSIGFAIDTTGSMSTEINGVKSTVANIVNNRIGTSEEPSQYVLSIINDPNVPVALSTDSSSEFLSRLGALYAGYGGNGGDCPELYGQGTYNAVIALQKGASLFTFTDASIKDPMSARMAGVQAANKNIKIVNSLTGSCETGRGLVRKSGSSNTPESATSSRSVSPQTYIYNDLYYTISDISGGQLFIISKSEAGKLAELADILADSYYTGIMSAGGKLLSGSAEEHEFKVDSQTDKISISFSLLDHATVTVYRPDGSIVAGNDPEVDVIVLSSAVAYQIKAPSVGTWKITLAGSGDYTINVAGSSPLSFDSLKFVEKGGREIESYFEVDGYPIAGKAQSIEAIIYGLTSDISFELRDRHGVALGNLPLEEVDFYPGVKTVFLKENVSIPSHDFMVYAYGKDVNGVNFERVLAKKIIPQTVGVMGPDDGYIPGDEETVYTFRVTNYGETDDFMFGVLDNQGFITNVSMYSANIPADGYVDVQVTLHPGISPVGTMSTITFLAAPMNDLSVLGNYASVNVIVAEPKPELLSFGETSLITTGAIINDGDVYVWGFRGSAQQGNNTKVVANKAKPAKVQSLSNVTQLTGGAYHLLALDADGDVYGWGQNIYGETGCTGTYVATPCKVIGNIVQIAAGEYYSMALDQNGQVWTWGHNLYGQLGDGGKKNRQMPVQAYLGGETARLIGGAYEGAFAVTEEGHVWAWGDNEASGLGFQGTKYGVQKIVRTPTRVPNLDQYANDIVYIAGGNGWGEALLKDGRVIGWGLHASLGQGTKKTNISSPVPVTILTGVKQLFARYVGSFALTTDGKLYTWGQTGGSAFPMVYGASPTLRTANGEVIAIGGGKEHLFYQTGDGELYGIGYNDLYKLDQNKCCAPNIDWPGRKITIQ